MKRYLTELVALIAGFFLHVLVPAGITVALAGLVVWVCFQTGFLIRDKSTQSPKPVCICKCGEAK